MYLNMECDNGSLDRTFECVPISVYAEILQSFNEKLSQRMTTLLVSCLGRCRNLWEALKEKLGESGDLVGREVLKELNAKNAANHLNL